MFGRKKIPNHPVDTLVGSNSEITGDLIFHGRCHIDGVVKGSVLERLYREVRSLRIYEGTTEIHKLIIAKEVLNDT